MHRKKWVDSEEHRRNGAQKQIKQNGKTGKTMRCVWCLSFPCLFRNWILWISNLWQFVYQGSGAVYLIETHGLIHYCNSPTIKPSKSCQYEWIMWWAEHTWLVYKIWIGMKIVQHWNAFLCNLTNTANTHSADRAHRGRNTLVLCNSKPPSPHLHTLYTSLNI